ncbi:MAG: DUF393 domain-containing protein [Bacteroidales bacterium]|nr:DUF393 domain-containing protein [Bacteroidales bacterium]
MNQADISGPAPLILYDGECPLCNASVRFVLRVDRQGNIRFSPLDSAYAREVLKAHFPEGKVPDSLIFVTNGCVDTRSDALLAILNYLPFPWRALVILRILPSWLRNLSYRLIAASRQMFGSENKACSLPDAEYKNRFVY